MANIYLFRRKTSANWTAANPVLMSGELGLETDTTKFKFGDGSTAWNSLAYAGASVGVVPWGSISGTLSAQTDLVAALAAKQATLVSATNIKTINGLSILGPGDLVVSGGGGSSITVKDEGSTITTALATLDFVGAGVTVTGGATATVTIPGGAAIPDGDKGDITVSGSGTVWTIDAGAVTVSQMANLAASTILGNNTGGAAAPIALTPAQARRVVDASNIAITATAGGTTTLTAASEDLQVFTGNSGQTVVMPDVTTLTLGRTFTIKHTGASTSITVQSSGGNAIGTTLFPGGAATYTCIALVGTDATPWLLTFDGAGTRAGSGSMVLNAAPLINNPTFGGIPIFPAGSTSGPSLRMPHGSAPSAPTDGDLWTETTGVYARVNGATVDLAAGGTPGGSTNEVQYNNAGAFAGAADVEIEGGQLRLPAIATPATPAAGGIKLFTKTALGQRDWPHILLPSGKEFGLQESFCEFQVNQFRPAPNSSLAVGDGSLPFTLTGTATAGVPTVADLLNLYPRVEARVTVAATNAVAGFRGTGNFVRIGRDANAPGGFYSTQMWAPTTGIGVATHRAFCGFTTSTAAPSDVEPSSIANQFGMGWDAADTNVQLFHNDGSGTATKIDLGASFPVPTAQGPVYQLELFSPNDLTQSVEYRVTLFNTTDKTAAAEVTGTITTDIPSVSTLLSPRMWCSVGGTSSIVGVALYGACVCREY